MSYGRGGAGNFQAAKQGKANSPAAPKTGQAVANGYKYDAQLAAEEMKQVRQQQQQYAHGGRGGAGLYSSIPMREVHRNTYSPKEILQDEAQMRTAAAGTSPRKTHGRGGAGNIAHGAMASEQEAAKKKLEEEQWARQVIENGAKARVLPKLPKAKLSGRESPIDPTYW
ncbi:hypothetical protein LTR37_006371 [Vermiconidia calcicola]|uniref:Uncharacterized protein n=1 Tax=Vermiconidia calcicola TaxID=1690605 RepID=A0ACC3NJ88_9PEZI|nr:hypothetical protein LTR37_006371 [Vermiconidia calcicola]